MLIENEPMFVGDDDADADEKKDEDRSAHHRCCRKTTGRSEENCRRHIFDVRALFTIALTNCLFESESNQRKFDTYETLMKYHTCVANFNQNNDIQDDAKEYFIDGSLASVLFGIQCWFMNLSRASTNSPSGNRKRNCRGSIERWDDRFLH